jgi:tetratricopeptide (TPR) repeat protein
MLITLVICLFATADGVKLYQQRDFSAAESEFRRKLAAQPSDAKSRLYLARTLLKLGRIPEALEEISRALAKQKDPDIVFEAGRIVREMAGERFADLERIAPESAAVHELAARHLEQQGKLAEALQEYRTAIGKDPARPGLHYEAGNILWRMREVDTAVAELQAELARTPHHGLANLRLGQVFLNRSQAAEAVVYLEHAVDAMPESTEARRELVKAYRSLGRTADARKQWEAVASASPDDDQVHYLLGNLYRQLGDAERAGRELNRHREILQRRNQRQ